MGVVPPIGLESIGRTWTRLAAEDISTGGTPTPATVHRRIASDMKHLVTALVTLLTVLPRDQDLVLGATKNACPRRYLRRINGKCYYFSVKKMTWFGALNNCLRKGLTLADLSNARDFDGAIGFLSSLGNTEDFWFGGNDLYHEGRFQYISNGRLVRYYSNYSNVLPVEHSDCDDCLEVRIRSTINMVAADNCLERQYFICSERYCQEDEEAKKPKHHSHEHLHHFHHDIGESADGEVEEENNDGGHNMLPIASGSAQHAGGSEEAVGQGDVPDEEEQPKNETVTEGSETVSTNGGEAAAVPGPPNANTTDAESPGVPAQGGTPGTPDTPGTPGTPGNPGSADAKPAEEKPADQPPP